MKGLDDWITGKNDPNAAFNQVDWVEQHNLIVNECDWITEEMLEDDDTYFDLQEVLENDVLPEFLKPFQHHHYDEEFNEDFYYFKHPGDYHKIITEHAKEIATKFKEAYERFNRRKPRGNS